MANPQNLEQQLNEVAEDAPNTHNVPASMMDTSLVRTFQNPSEQDPQSSNSTRTISLDRLNESAVEKRMCKAPYHTPQGLEPETPSQALLSDPPCSTPQGQKRGGEHVEEQGARRRVGKRSITGQKKTPFMEEVLKDELLANFRQVMFEYAGISDPWDHICRFKNTAMLHQFSEGLKCRVCATTITGPAQQWYSQLAIESFRTYD